MWPRNENMNLSDQADCQQKRTGEAQYQTGVSGTNVVPICLQYSYIKGNIDIFVVKLNNSVTFQRFLGA
jgi:hypothetical protein